MDMFLSLFYFSAIAVNKAKVLNSKLGKNDYRNSIQKLCLPKKSWWYTIHFFSSNQTEVRSLALGTLVYQCWLTNVEPWLTNVEPWLTNVGFFHFSPDFCHIWWFFKVDSTKSDKKYNSYWKIIKYGKNVGGNEKNQRWLTKVQHWLTNVGKPRFNLG